MHCIALGLIGISFLLFEKYIDLSFEQLASELGISTHLVMLKFNNLSNDKKKELEEIYINNYSLFNSI